MALGRLAATETAGLADMAITASWEKDKIDALRRVGKDLGLDGAALVAAYRKMEQSIRDAELTINFFAYKFFNRMPHGTRYMSQYEGGNQWGDLAYMQSRDEAEDSMFAYSKGGLLGTLKGKAAEVSQRVESLGSWDAQRNATFHAAMRPKYAALNIARLKYGSASQWGKSHVVLKPHLKMNATLFHTDSFDEAGSARSRAKMAGMVANIYSPARLLSNMAPGLLQALYASSKAADGPRADSVPGVGKTGYIEAHLHADVQFARDVATLVVHRGELAQSAVETGKLNEKNPKAWKRLKPAEVQKNFEKFCRVNSIALQYVD